MDGGRAAEGWAGGLRTSHRRLIFFVLVALFVVQTGLTWTSSTEVVAGKGTLDAAAYRGRQLYQDFNCTACHQFYGLGGYMGPDLTNVTRAKGKGRDYSIGIILHGTERMPALGVSAAEADDLVAYLDAWAASGTYPVRALNLTPWGTYLEMHSGNDS
jgi:nitric oxide reductase subunit C